jgi:hypothetical protein
VVLRVMMQRFLHSAGPCLVLVGLAAVSLSCNGENEPASVSGHGVIENVEVPFDVALDPQSVTAETVSLTFHRRAGPDAVKVGVRYDADRRTVTVDPLPALWYGQEHLLVLDGLREASGAPVPRCEVRFRTAVNPIQRIKEVSSGSGGSVTRLRVHANDEQGRTTGIEGYAWEGETPWPIDDVLRDYWLVVRDGSVVTLSAYDPGEDGKLRTADDIPFGGTDEYLDAQGMVIRTVEWTNGPAGRTVRSYVEDVTGDDGEVTRVVDYGDPGVDAVWFTDDDVPRVYRQYRYDDGGRLASWLAHGDSGDDALWFTADDPVLYATTWTYDDADAERTSVGYSSPGDDRTWLTADDVVDGHSRWTRDERGLATELRTFEGEGGDGVWFTEDDDVIETERTEYDARGSRRERVRWFWGATETTTYDVRL